MPVYPGGRSFAGGERPGAVKLPQLISGLTERDIVLVRKIYYRSEGEKSIMRSILTPGHAFGQGLLFLAQPEGVLRGSCRRGSSSPPGTVGKARRAVPSASRPAVRRPSTPSDRGETVEPPFEKEMFESRTSKAASPPPPGVPSGILFLLEVDFIRIVQE
jgi:hypothetical protein